MVFNLQRKMSADRAWDWRTRQALRALAWHRVKTPVSPLPLTFPPEVELAFLPGRPVS